MASGETEAVTEEGALRGEATLPADPVHAAGTASVTAEAHGQPPVNASAGEEIS